MACRARTAFANSCSNCFVLGPVVIQPERRVSVTSRISSSSKSGRANGRNDSRIGTVEGTVIALNVHDVLVHRSSFGRRIGAAELKGLRDIEGFDGAIIEAVCREPDRFSSTPHPP